LNICHFVSFGIGGADRASFNIVKGLVSQGIKPIVAYNENSFPKKTLDNDSSLPVLSIFNEYLDLKNAKQIELHSLKDTKELTQLDIDILNTHRSGNDHWLIPELDKLSGCFKIVETNFHGEIETPADFRIYPSLSMLRGRMGLGPFKIIPNAIERPITSERLDPASTIDGKIVLGRLARADKSIYTKNIFKILRRIDSRYFELYFGGASTYARQDASRYGIKNVNWFEPSTSRIFVSRFLNSMDILLHVNRLGETFGNVVAEAMMHSKPVISLAGDSNYPQAQFELLNDPFQFVTKKGQFAKNLKMLIDSEDLRSNLGHMNKQRAEELFSEEVVARKYLKVYERLLT